MYVLQKITFYCFQFNIISSLKIYCSFVVNVFLFCKIVTIETSLSGIILQDLTFVHIGNPNMLPEDHCGGRVDVVNFAKRWQQYTILDNMRRFKAW